MSEEPTSASELLHRLESAFPDRTPGGQYVMPLPTIEQIKQRIERLETRLAALEKRGCKQREF